MREEPGQSPAAPTTRRGVPRRGGLILNPDSWRKIRKTAANVYPDSMFELSAFCLSRTDRLPSDRRAAGPNRLASRMFAPSPARGLRAHDGLGPI
jgi:hypothetical protein